MTDSKPSDAKSDSTSSAGRGGKGGRGGRGGRGNRSPTTSTNAKNKATAKVTTPTFVGMCKKELLGKVIIYSESRANMAAQWIKFERAVYDAAGKVDGTLAGAIANKKPLTLADFLTPEDDYAEEYTTTLADGTAKIDAKKKALYDRAEELLVNNSVTAYGVYIKGWEQFFF